METIVGNDEELGFELFEKSRSATVKNALNGIATEPAYNSYNGLTSDKAIIQQENMLEQMLIERTVSYHPQRAINYLRQKPSPPITPYTMKILKSLQEKDKAIADELTAEVIKQLLATDFTTGSSEFGFASQILQQDPAFNSLKIDAQTLHQIAEKVADFLIIKANKDSAPSYTYLTPVLIKYLPERKTELTEKTMQPPRSMIEIFPINKEARDLLNSKTTPEQLLSQADKFPAGFREQIYIKAINQIALEGDVNRAKEILTQKFQKERLQEMFGNLYWYLMSQKTEKAEFDKSFELLELLPERYKFNSLIHLANKMYAQKYEDKQKLLEVLAKARQTLSESPDTNQDFGKFGELASIYVLIDKETGFVLLEKLIKKHIEISEASAIVDNFQGNTNIRKNEFLIGSGWRGLANFNVSLTNFVKVDFGRTVKTISKVPRLDQKINLELFIIEKAYNL